MKDEVTVAFAVNHKICAIKAVRSAFSLGLKEAKEVIEAVVDNRQTLRMTETQLGRLMACIGEIGPQIVIQHGEELLDHRGNRVRSFSRQLVSPGP